MSSASPATERPASAPIPRGFYKSHIGDLPRRLLDAVPPEELRALHARSGWRHLAVALRHAVLGAALVWVMVRFEQPWIWIPAAALQGCVILGWIILLHDVIHRCVFRHQRPRVSRLLGLLYALPSAISASQFERWHLDHHRELGSASEDPKRAHLSPKRNARWLKALYMTPALFVIYAVAAAREARTYPPELRRTITVERVANMAVHGLAVWALWTVAGGDAALRAYVVPMFVFFPMAFTLNRLGQHYWIDPGDAAKWGTRMDGGVLLNFLFLNSNLHLEHHYFPSVPLYRLPALNRRLRPFWDRIGHPARTYRQLLWKWFVENGEPHADWG